jgi:hypothetical protein
MTSPTSTPSASSTSPQSGPSSTNPNTIISPQHHHDHQTNNNINIISMTIINITLE